MTETRTEYDAAQPESTDLPAIVARLAAVPDGDYKLHKPGWVDHWTIDVTIVENGVQFSFIVASCYEEIYAELFAHAPADLRALVDEVKRLRHDDAIWDKHSLVQIVTERNELREEVKRLQALLETEQRAKWVAEQDKQHWQEKAERMRTQLQGIIERSIDDQWGCPLCPDAGDYDSSGDFWHEDDCVYDQLIPKLELSE